MALIVPYATSLVSLINANSNIPPLKKLLLPCCLHSITLRFIFVPVLLTFLSHMFNQNKCLMWWVLFEQTITEKTQSVVADALSRL